MNLRAFLGLLEAAPIVASVQASPGSPTADPHVLATLARASLDQGVRILRLEGVEAIRTVHQQTAAPCIGLIKREYPGSPVYITPTEKEVDELLQTPCIAIAIDATLRQRPNGATLPSLVEKIHSAGRLALADCDSLESGQAALAAGCDLLGTTLSGYTKAGPPPQGPDIPLVLALAGLGCPVLAEGRYQAEWQVRAAIRAGAAGVVMGGAINDPTKQTRRFCSAAQTQGSIAAFDLGGTWLRFGHFDRHLALLASDRTPAPTSHAKRMEWIHEKCRSVNASVVGISAGGTIWEGVVQEAKSFIPDYEGRSLTVPGLPTYAINDGLATAWGHATHPDYAGKRVATLALGTGVGAGIAERDRLFIGPQGGYPRINDAFLSNGRTIESVLGGLGENQDPSELVEAFMGALGAIQVASPDVVVLCGGVGLGRQDLFIAAAREAGARVAASPYGAHAGIFGAAAMAAYPPDNFPEPSR